MSKLALLFIGAASVLVFLPQFSSLDNQVLGAADLNPSALASLINVSRNQADVPPLTLSSALTQAARAKATDMLQKGYWSHESISQSSPWEFIDQAGYQYELAGENLARDYPTEADVVQAWLNSPPHRSNLLNAEFRHMGLAIITGTNPNGRPSTVVVQLLAKPSAHNATMSRFLQTSALTFNPNKKTLTVVALIGLTTTVILLAFLFYRRHQKNRLDISLWHH